MSAPDKIYINPEYDLYRTQKNPPFEETYVRKDYLLEWAKKLKERWEEPPMSKHSPGCVYMLEQVINKLESDVI